jgi:hypothetical protein
VVGDMYLRDDRAIDLFGHIKYGTEQDQQRCWKRIRLDIDLESYSRKQAEEQFAKLDPADPTSVAQHLMVLGSQGKQPQKDVAIRVVREVDMTPAPPKMTTFNVADKVVVRRSRNKGKKIIWVKATVKLVDDTAVYVYFDDDETTQETWDQPDVKIITNGVDGDSFFAVRCFNRVKDVIHLQGQCERRRRWYGSSGQLGQPAEPCSSRPPVLPPVLPLKKDGEQAKERVHMVPHAAAAPSKGKAFCAQDTQDAEAGARLLPSATQPAMPASAAMEVASPPVAGSALVFASQSACACSHRTRVIHHALRVVREEVGAGAGVAGGGGAAVAAGGGSSSAMVASVGSGAGSLAPSVPSAHVSAMASRQGSTYTGANNLDWTRFAVPEGLAPDAKRRWCQYIAAHFPTLTLQDDSGAEGVQHGDRGEDGGAAKGRKRRKSIPQGGPKKPATSFVLFSNTVREQVKEENPGLSFLDLGKKLGEMWREMDPQVFRARVCVCGCPCAHAMPLPPVLLGARAVGLPLTPRCLVRAGAQGI